MVTFILVCLMCIGYGVIGGWALITGIGVASIILKILCYTFMCSMIACIFFGVQAAIYTFKLWKDKRALKQKYGNKDKVDVDG